MKLLLLSIILIGCSPTVIVRLTTIDSELLSDYNGYCIYYTDSKRNSWFMDDCGRFEIGDTIKFTRR